MTIGMSNESTFKHQVLIISYINKKNCQNAIIYFGVSTCLLFIFQQPAPATNAFLASAANIMMGVGLAQRGHTDNRFDAYKGLQGNIRRY